MIWGGMPHNSTWDPLGGFTAEVALGEVQALGHRSLVLFVRAQGLV